MSQPQAEDLSQRLRALERSRRRWKGMALGLLAFVTVLLVVGTGLGLVQRYRAVEAERAAREHLRQAEAERNRAEQLRRQAREETSKGKKP